MCDKSKLPLYRLTEEIFNCNECNWKCFNKIDKRGVNIINCSMWPPGVLDLKQDQLKNKYEVIFCLLNPGTAYK